MTTQTVKKISNVAKIIKALNKKGWHTSSSDARTIDEKEVQCLDGAKFVMYSDFIQIIGGSRYYVAINKRGLVTTHGDTEEWEALGGLKADCDKE